MDVRMLWGKRRESYPGEYAPELMVAWDEYCIDANGDGYEVAKADEIKSWGNDLVESREIFVTIPDDVIDGLFEIPVFASPLVSGEGPSDE